MRCPKCGYISFDHLIACSNCSRDISALVDELHGTSIESDLSLFLGSVIGEEPTAMDLQSDELVFATSQAEDLILDEELPQEGEITIQLDEASLKQVPEESALDLEPESPPELTLDMDEISSLDFSQIEGEATGIEEPSDQTAMLFSEAGEFQGGQEEQLTLNLDEIDLSDLAPLDEAQTESTAPQIVAEPEVEPELTLDLGRDSDHDAGAPLDLGAFLEEDQSTPILDLEDFMAGTGLERPEDAHGLYDLLSKKPESAAKPTTAESGMLLDLDLGDDSNSTHDLSELKLSLESDDDKR
jgi:hypothetical protein